MLETFTAQTFSPYTGETFRLFVEGIEPLELQLLSVREMGATTEEGSGQPAMRVPFSVVFRGRPDIYLPQHIYRLEHPQLGAMELFIVPIGPDAEGMRYEAIFG